MNISRRMAVASLALSLLFVTSAQAASGWDGTWSGAWGGSASEATSVKIANNRVVSFEYQGVSTPVENSKVTPTKVVYGDNGTVVTLTKTSNTTAFATLHSSQGDATAKLTKQ